MNKIIPFIANKTDGLSYRSFKYCIDATSVPHIEYDDKKDIRVHKKGETASIKNTCDMGKLAKSKTLNKPLFKYFLDGSRRTYKVDDLAYGRRLYPVIAGQIGIACCERLDPDSFKGFEFDNSLVISIPTDANADSSNDELFFNNLLLKLNEQDFIKKRGVQFNKLLAYKTTLDQERGEKYEHKAIATIQDEMIDREKRLVEKLAKRRDLTSDAYLIKDGSLEYPKMSDRGNFGELSAFKANYRCVIGVSKAFNPESLSSNVKDIAKVIAGLPKHHRTPAMKYQAERVGDVWFSVWYLRIRDIEYCQSPYDGVVKIEKILISDSEIENGLDSDEIDLISANIINESFPVCYGKDDRWAKHLYPIFLTEQYIKSQYLSDHHFINLF